jgi:hypothetical protein
LRRAIGVVRAESIDPADPDRIAGRLLSVSVSVSARGADSEALAILPPT